jgi:hypothetical protein
MARPRSTDEILRAAGFRGEGLRKARAIMLAESTGRPAAHNTNHATGDDSYGLFQINMLGDLGPDRRRRYGLKSNDDLLDPVVNARVAFQMSKGGKDWSPWSTYKSGAYKKHLGAKAPLVGVAPPTMTGPLLAPPPGGTLPVMDMRSTALGNLGRIAMGERPTDTLGDLVSAARMPTPQVPKGLTLVDPQGKPVTKAVKTTDPGGGWGGSYDPATALANIGRRHGLVSTSEKRDRKSTASGGVSDHWVGSKNSYAYDLGGDVSAMDKAAIDIAASLGVKYNGRGPLVLTKTVGGIRYQVLYRTTVGGNHFDHIHTAAKRIK